MQRNVLYTSRLETFSLIVLVSITTSCSPSPEESRSTKKSLTATNTVADAENTRKLLADIEHRLNSNTKHLKKYYATREQVQQASTDSWKLVLLKAQYNLVKADSLQEFMAKISKLLPKVQRQARSLYRSSLEEIFVKNGLNIDVITTGSEGKTLKVSYVLMSQPLVYKFQNEFKIQDQASSFGFRKIIYTNGFESSLGQTWTADLTGK